jgi:voltage-gated potassium channel
MTTQLAARKNLLDSLREKSQLLQAPVDKRLAGIRRAALNEEELRQRLQRQGTHSKFSNLAGITHKNRTINNPVGHSTSNLSLKVLDSVMYKKYKQFQKILYLLLEEPLSSPLSKFIFCIIMVCIAASAIEEVIVNSHSTPYKPSGFIVMDVITSTVFIIELIFRLMSASAFGESLRSYILRPLFIIDFIAILPPFFEGFGNKNLALNIVVHSKVLGLFRIFRIFKIARYIKDASIFIEGVKKSLADFGFLILLMIIANLTFATMIYYLESKEKESKLSSGIPSAIWWALVTMSTVGYGDTVPLTPQGKVIASMTAIFGNLMLTLPVVILGYNFQEVYANKLEEKQVSKLKESVLAKVDTATMTVDKKEISFMRQRIAGIEATNKHIMESLGKSENLYKKVSLDLKDLFRSVYLEMDNAEEKRGTSLFNQKIKVMERLAKAKRKIKLVHLFKRHANEKKDSDSSHIKTDKEESPTKTKDGNAIKNILGMKNEEKSLTFGDSFEDNEEDPPKIITIHYPLRKKLEKTHIPSEDCSSESEFEEPNKLCTLPIQGSILYKEKVRRERQQMFKEFREGTSQSIKPLKTIIEKRQSPLRTPESKRSSIANLFCIKSHSMDNPNNFLKYRNERLKFLDTKILNELLDDWGEVEAGRIGMDSNEDNSSSSMADKLDEGPKRGWYRRDMRQTTNLDNGYETLRKLLPTDDEGGGATSRRELDLRRRKFSNKKF